MTDAQSKGPSKLYRSVFLVVAGLIAFSLTVTAFFFYSERFSQTAVAWYVDKNAERLGLKIELENFSGSMASGFRLAKLSVRRRNPPMQLVVSDVAISADFSRILTGGKILVSASLDRLDLAGMAACPIASSSVPDYHAFSCFVGLPASVEIVDFSMEHAVLRPFHDFPLLFTLEKIAMQPGIGSDVYQLQATVGASLRDNQVGHGSFAGVVKQHQNRVEGSLNLQLFGQKLQTEISCSGRRGCNEISGYISSTTLDISKISHWLIPLWQDVFPFGFDGMIDCSGSWMFNQEVGFLGNLSGSCHHLRMVAQGLFITLIELNGNWKLFDGNFSFADEGSRFFGFPASLTGGIEGALQSSRKWELDFNCLDIDFTSMVEGLPWGVKYGMALPPLSGGATLSAQIRGNRPELTARLSTNDLNVGKGAEKRVVSGTITYLSGAAGSGDFSIDMVCRSEQALPPVFSRFKSGTDRFDRHIAVWRGPGLWQYELKGSDTADLSFKGRLQSDAGNSVDISGHWHDGMGSMSLLQNQKVFTADSIPLLDLILAK